MKILIPVMMLMIFLLSPGCSDDCEKENPTIILINHGTGKADIQIKTSGGNTENINNIEIGTASEKRSFAPGNIEFTINIQGVTDPVLYNLKISYCFDYIVTINPDNTVTGSARRRD